MVGFAEIGRGIGFSLAERREGVSADLGSKAFLGYLEVLQSLYDRLPGGFACLVDNGAVQEVDLLTQTAVAPISDAQWALRMGRYVELATRFGDAMWLITPDRIFDQEETIRRFTICAPALRKAALAGAILVLTLQPGALGPIALEVRLRKLLPRVDDRQIVPAFPMRQRGDDRTQTVTPIPALLEFLARRRPHTVHLLGMGLKSRLLPGILKQIGTVSPGTRVTLDAADVRSVAVPGRPWMQEKPWAQKQIGRRPPYQADAQIDETEIVFDLPQEGLRAAAREAGASAACAERFAVDPERMYALLVAWHEDEADDPCWGEVEPGTLDLALLHERYRWEPKFPPSAGASERDRLLVHRVFGRRRDT
jgi:hypothetical protein